MSITIRAARAEDGPELGRYGASLARQHHDFDAQRFMLPEELEAGYRGWLLKEAKSKRAVVIVAVDERDKAVGYAYGRLEERDWNALLDAHGGFHDIWVADSARRQGVGKLLAEELMKRLVALGAPRVVLMTAARNEAAQRLFQSLGWRATMIEMTREA